MISPYFFQAEDGIRDLVRSRGLGDVYKRQMIMIPEGKPGAGGYREHDILVIKEDGAENITKFPFGPSHNVIKN